jgi:tetratricopeptide (TPR) repeat protein
MYRFIISLSAICFVLLSCGADDNSKKTSEVPSEHKTMDSITNEIAKARKFQESGQHEKALSITDAMIERYPGQLDALTIKAEILKAQGKTEEALRLMERAFALQPRDKESMYNLAYEYADAKNPKTLALTDTLIKYDKTETVARAWYIKATYYNNTGNEKEAMRYYDSSNAADYNFLDTYLDKGQLQFRQKNYDAALKTFALGQKLSPAAPEFYFWVAKIQEVKGSLSDAKANYERAYSLDRSFTEAKEAAEKIKVDD